MATDLATLAIRVDASQARSELSGLEGALGKLKSAVAALGVTFSAGLALKKFVDETSQAQYAVAQLEARLRSTGGVAGQSLTQLQAFASELQRLTTYSDEAVMGAQALLLTFTNIRGDVFPGATKAALNLATAMGGDVKAAALQLGKALQDPAQGLTALRRSGVSFSDAQQQVIKALFDTGRQAEAQRMILAELETEFGGAAEAARNTLGGALAGLKNAWGELFEVTRASSAGMIGAINGLTKALPVLRNAFEAFVGGIRLLYVDLVTHIQQGNARFYTDSAKLIQILGTAFAYIPGMTSAAGAMLGYAAQLEAKGKTLADAFAAWRREQEALITGTGPAAAQINVVTTAAAQLAETAGRAARAVQQIRLPLSGTVETGGAVPGVTNELQRQNEVRLWQWREQQGEAAAKAEVARREKTEQELQAIRENYLRQWQQTFSDSLTQLLTGGLTSWQAFFDTLAQYGARALGDALGQVLAKASAGLQGMLGIGAGGFGTGYSAGHAVGGGKGILAGTVAGAGQGAAAGAALGALGGPIGALGGALIGGAAGFIGSLFGVNKASQEAAEQQLRYNEALRQSRLAAEAATRAEQERRAVAERDLTFDLRGRQLRASGMTDEAAAMELWARQVQEFADAVRNGVGEELLAELARTQEIERQMLALQQAAAAEQKLADQRAEWARQAEALAQRVADAQQRSAEASERLAFATEDLGVRLLRAQGKTEEADRKAFESEQRREVLAARQAVRETISPELQKEANYFALATRGLGGYGYIREEWDAFRVVWEEAMQAKAEAQAYLDQLLATQAAEAAAFGRGQSMPGASAAVPGTRGSFGTIVSRTTAEQGDRMVDQLVTMRTLAQEFWPYLRDIAEQLRGGVNRMLGAAYQRDAGLAGAATVT